MKYELMAILDPSKTEKEQEKLLDEIKKLFADHGLAFVEEDIWGIRSMAYKMKGFSSGYYAVINFEGEGTELPALNKELLLLQGLVRYVILKMPEDYSLMRYDENTVQAVAKKPRLSKQAEELQEKVKKSSKKEEQKEEKEVIEEEEVVEETKEEEAVSVEEAPEVVEEVEEVEEVEAPKEPTEEEKKATLDEKLQAIIDDTDINI